MIMHCHVVPHLEVPNFEYEKREGPGDEAITYLLGMS